jgi:hypothetical protein
MGRLYKCSTKIATVCFKYLSMLLVSVWGAFLQLQNICFKEFPDQCARCPEYSETTKDQSMQLMWLTGTGIVYPPLYMYKIIKECKRYNKRKIEYIR